MIVIALMQSEDPNVCAYEQDDDAVYEKHPVEDLQAEGTALHDNKQG